MTWQRIGPSPESSQPFTDDELKLIHDAAQEVGEVDVVTMFELFGLHPICLARAGPENLIKTLEHGQDRHYCQWRRAKTGAPVNFPVPAGKVEWLKHYLSTNRPKTRVGYNHQLVKVQQQLKRKGYSINCAPRRFRHTLAVKLLKQGYQETLVRQLLKVHPKTLETYATLSRGSIYDQMEQKGWPY